MSISRQRPHKLGDDFTVTLISPLELDALQREGERLCLLDVRWRLDLPLGRPAYLEAHLPGAVYVDLEEELAERPDPLWGQHPLPSTDRLQRAARRWGLNSGDIVVVYDDVSSVAAARAWWLLSNSGVSDVRVLDGGLRGWAALGLPLETGDVQPREGDIALHELDAPLARLDQLDPLAAGTVLLDVRSADRYRGTRHTDERVSGHIPGAVNLSTVVHLDGGEFRSPDVIARLFRTQGIDARTDVIAYCGSGIAATHTIFAASLAGLDFALFPGGWSQWSHARGRWLAEGAAADGSRQRV